MWNRQSNQTGEAEGSPRPPGVIDTIGMGYEAIASRPILIVPPVLLDLYFWLGAHITSRPLTVQLAGWLRNQEWSGERVANLVEGRTQDNINELAAFWSPTLRVPSFVSAISSDVPYRIDSWRPVVSLSSWGVALAILILTIAGLLIGAEYLLAIAAAVGRTGAAERRVPGTGVLRGALWLVSWYALVVIVSLLVFWPVLAGFIAAEMTAAGSTFWLILLLFLPMSWAFVLFFFSIQAMFVDGIGPLAALRSSYQVVRADSWNALGVIVAHFLLTVGFPQVWNLLLPGPAGVMVAIVGHSIIATGMIAATMVFYRDRVQYLNAAGRI